MRVGQAMMRRRRIGTGVALVFALLLCPTIAGAQSGFWDNFFRGSQASQPATTPCVLDKCLNGATPKPTPAQTAPEKEAYERLKREFEFNPRSEWE